MTNSVLGSGEIVYQVMNFAQYILEWWYSFEIWSYGGRFTSLKYFDVKMTRTPMKTRIVLTTKVRWRLNCWVKLHLPELRLGHPMKQKYGVKEIELVSIIKRVLNKNCSPTRQSNSIQSFLLLCSTANSAMALFPSIWLKLEHTGLLC